MKDEHLDQKNSNFILCMTNTARILCAQFWKKTEISSVEEWWTKVLDFAGMDKLTNLL